MSSVAEAAVPATRRLTIREAEPTTMLLRGGFLFDPRKRLDGPGDLLIEAGRIVAIGEPGSIELPAGVEEIQAAGLHLFPGFVDPHVHFRAPGREDEEDLDSGTRAAAAGGFCTVIAMPNTDPALDSASVLRSLQDDAESKARIGVGFLPAITKGLAGESLTEMTELVAAGALGFSDDGFPVRSARLMRRALEYQKLCGGVLALHEEDPDLSGEGVMHEGAVSAELGLSGIPAVSESTAIERDAALVRYEEGRIHILHLSAIESVEAVASAKQCGTRITAEVTPHHLLLTDEAVRSLDTRFKMNPPLRAERDRQALIDGLKSGVIDCIATDHAPHAIEEKERAFELASMGVTGLETAFAALYTELVLPGVLGLDTLVDRLTAGAAVYDLETPQIALEAEANLCLVNLDSAWTVGADGYESRSKNSCFAGRTFRGQVLLTVAAGQEAYRRRSFAVHSASESQSQSQ